MNKNKPARSRRHFPWGALLAAAALAAPFADAGTLWNGPVTNYTHTARQAGNPTAATSTDQITSRVWLSRSHREPLFNAVSEDSWTDGNSPADTKWAFGTTNNYLSLDYEPWGTTIGGPGIGSVAAVVLNQPMVVHLMTDDVYIGITFTSWTMSGGAVNGGGFQYTRSTRPAVVAPPTVSLSAPANGAVFAAPAMVSLTATTGGSGTVTNVQYFAGAISLGRATASPFALGGSLPNAGSYALTAVATAGGVTGTSAVVNISVITPVAVSISPPALTGNQFIFAYNADPGLSYVIQTSSDLTTWSSVVTNVAAGNPVSATNTVAPIGPHFYRVGRLPNPP